MYEIDDERYIRKQLAKIETAEQDEPFEATFRRGIPREHQEQSLILPEGVWVWIDTEDIHPLLRKVRAITPFNIVYDGLYSDIYDCRTLGSNCRTVYSLDRENKFTPPSYLPDPQNQRPLYNFLYNVCLGEGNNNLETFDDDDLLDI